MAQARQRGIEGLEQVSSRDVIDSVRQGLDYDALAGKSIPRRHEVIALDDFEAYLADADYDGRYPEYVESFAKAYRDLGRDTSQVNRKFFEQFLSIHLTRPGEGNVVCDIAAAHGAFSSIVKRLCALKTSYHQDLNTPSRRVFPYLDSDDIVLVQGNAAELPFEDGEIDHMYLLNSWEHFQAPTDLDYLKEAERCLKPGGNSVIVPLNGASKAIVTTDPALWKTKQVYEENKPPLFRKGVAVNLDAIGQVYAQYHDAGLIGNFAEATPGLSHEIVTVSPDTEVSWFPEKSWDVLISTRKS